MRTGSTLPELTLVLLLMGMVTGGTLSVARSWQDVLSVRSARESVLDLLHETRGVARLVGGAVAVLDEVGESWIEGADGVPVRALDLDDWGVRLEIQGSRTRAELRYGARGVASFASTTVVFRRGKAEARLVVSAQGRIRR